MLALLPMTLSCRGGSSETPRPFTSAPTPTSSPSGASNAPPCVPPPPGGRGRPGLERTITVFLFCGSDGLEFTPDLLRPVERVVPEDGAPLRAAVTQLLVGVTPKEAAAGLSSSFSTYTVGQLRSATIENRIATLDLTGGFRDTNNYSASTASMFVMGQITATVFHFPEIDGLEFKIDGERWCGWENPCQGGVPVPLVTRP